MKLYRYEISFRNKAMTERKETGFFYRELTRKAFDYIESERYENIGRMFKELHAPMGEETLSFNDDSVFYFTEEGYNHYESAINDLYDMYGNMMNSERYWDWDIEIKGFSIDTNIVRKYKIHYQDHYQVCMEILK